jgi:L-glyceraldehyde 3-phosphate reductase
MPYTAEPKRYAEMIYRRCGNSGLDLPAISLGLWQNFGGVDSFEAGRCMLCHAFDRGVTHFDLANNYGPPPGSSEEMFGKVMAMDLKPYRDEIIVSTKGGYLMWPGPYGEWGSRKYMRATLDQSLKRLGLDYVDIFYSHRLDPNTPLEETMGALATAIQQGKALYVGVSSYSPEMTRRAHAILADMGVRVLIHQPSYSMLNRWVESGLLKTLGELGMGCIAFSPLAQGMLSDKYLDGIPAGSRATKDSPLKPAMITEDYLKRIRGLDAIAKRRGQSLAQMAVAWVLRNSEVTTALVGTSSAAQLDNTLAALKNLSFSKEELTEIDKFAVDSGIDLWRTSSTAKSEH